MAPPHPLYGNVDIPFKVLRKLQKIIAQDHAKLIAIHMQKNRKSS